MEPSIATCSTSPLGTVAEVAEVAEKAALGSHWNLAAAKIMKEPGALDSLVKSLSQDSDLTLQKLAAKTLRNLAAAGDQSIKLQILNREGALKGLVKLLAESDSELRDAVTKIAVQTLRNLAAADANCIKIVNDKEAREGLVDCLFEDGNNALREQAAWALKELARGSPETIVMHQRAVEGFVKALSEHGQPGLQECALTFLLDFALIESEMIPYDKDAMRNLLECVFATGEPGLQKSAFRVLESILHNCIDYQSMIEILLHEELFIPGLVSCLFVDDDHDLQEGAVRILYTLWNNYDSMKESIVDEGDTITGLLTCMSATDKPSLQLKAIQVLVKRANYELDDSDREAIAVQIAKENGAIAGFVKCLSANSNFQKISAAAALASLAEMEDATVKRRIIEEDGAISSLVECMSSPLIELKREATRALANITKGSGTCGKRRKIVLESEKEQEQAYYVNPFTLHRWQSQLSSRK